MDSGLFDSLATGVAAQLTRRRTVGLLSLLGAASLGLANDADARKKRKKKRKKKKDKPKTKTCTGCSACETCVDDVCQPKAEGAPCGDGGVCTHGTCGLPCTFDDDQCPEGTFCPLESTVCVTEFFCERPCATNADCSVGEICMATQCAGVTLRCGQVAPV